MATGYVPQGRDNGPSKSGKGSCVDPWATQRAEKAQKVPKIRTQYSQPPRPATEGMLKVGPGQGRSRKADTQVSNLGAGFQSKNAGLERHPHGGRARRSLTPNEPARCPWKPEDLPETQIRRNGKAVQPVVHPQAATPWGAELGYGSKKPGEMKLNFPGNAPARSPLPDRTPRNQRGVSNPVLFPGFKKKCGPKEGTKEEWGLYGKPNRGKQKFADSRTTLQGPNSGANSAETTPNRGRACNTPQRHRPTGLWGPDPSDQAQMHGDACTGLGRPRGRSASAQPVQRQWDSPFATDADLGCVPPRDAPRGPRSCSPTFGQSAADNNFLSHPGGEESYKSSSSYAGMSSFADAPPSATNFKGGTTVFRPSSRQFSRSGAAAHNLAMCDM